MKMKSEEIMSEVENLEVESNPTLDLINALQRGDFNTADELFKDALGAKVQDTLDAEKVAVAGQIFNGEEPYDDVDEDEEEGIEDDELESSLEEIEDVDLDEIDDFLEVD